MSDINLDFTVSNNSIDFTVQPNDITITPTDIQLSIYSSGAPLARGANMEVQYNNEGLLQGNPAFTFDQDVGLLSIANIATSGLLATGIVNIGNSISSNVNITANTFLAVNMVATTANIQNGTINANSITSVHSNLGNVANLTITGGVNGYVLQTDGAGNLDWTAMTGGGGNGTPGGTNTQIQYNDAGTFGGNAGFTFNEVSGLVNMPGNLTAAGNITANYFIGNFSGNAGNSNYAAYAGNVVNSAQPNITSTGTLVSLNVTGNIAGNSYLGALGNVLYGIESISIIGAQTGTYNMDLISNAIKYSTANAASNLTLNFRGNSTVTLNSLIASSQSITSTYVMKNGATAYGVTAIQIDGTSQTIKWVNGLTPTLVPNASSSYTFTLIKTSSTPTYDVLGSATRYI